MSEFPTQKITIYHKEENSALSCFIVEASIRHTYTLNHNKTGNSSVDKVLIRIFDVDNKGVNYVVSDGDIIVDGEVKDAIQGTAPQSQLSAKYGKEHVFKVSSVDYFKFDDSDLGEENHTKLGCI